MLNHVFKMLEKNAAEVPERIALGDESGEITYREYLESADKVSAWLIRHAGGEIAEKPVAVLIDRNIKSVICFMGIAGSGAFYVPLDPAMPAHRLEIMINEISPVFIINASSGKTDSISADASLDEILKEDITENEQNKLVQVRKNIIDSDPLYSIFTSGSTGIPKAVLISQRGVLDLVQAFEDAFSFPDGTVFGNQAPFDFDVSVKDIYNALYCAGTVQIIPKKCFVMPKLLMQYIADKKVDTIIWAVSAVRIVADFKVLDDPDIKKPVNLRNVMFSGEVMPVKALNYWMDHYPETQFVNLYGPTEITCNCTYYKIRKRFQPNEQIPVGTEFSNTRVFLADPSGKKIEDYNVVGEICVKGSGLALGYYNNPEKTREVFTWDPETKGFCDRIYKTGDLGYYSVNGELMFANRADSQIKHMGHRIELGEIETALNAIPFINVACCIYNTDSERIICFYQAEKECRRAIVAELSKSLPKYMWPNKYVYKEQMPMNSHGKIDRALLKNEMTGSV